jgi:hypothetical protein
VDNFDSTQPQLSRNGARIAQQRGSNTILVGFFDLLRRPPVVRTQKANARRHFGRQKCDRRATPDNKL